MNTTTKFPVGTSARGNWPLGDYWYCWHYRTFHMFSPIFSVILFCSWNIVASRRSSCRGERKFAFSKADWLGFWWFKINLLVFSFPKDAVLLVGTKKLKHLGQMCSFVEFLLKNMLHMKLHYFRKASSHILHSSLAWGFLPLLRLEKFATKMDGHINL